MTDDEKALLAREIAADGYQPLSKWDDDPRHAFVAGWEAALKWKEHAYASQLEQSPVTE